MPINMVETPSGAASANHSQIGRKTVDNYAVSWDDTIVKIFNNISYADYASEFHLGNDWTGSLLKSCTAPRHLFCEVSP